MSDDSARTDSFAPSNPARGAASHREEQHVRAADALPVEGLDGLLIAGDSVLAQRQGVKVIHVHAQEIEASPVLVTGPVDVSAEETAEFLTEQDAGAPEPSPKV